MKAVAAKLWTDHQLPGFRYAVAKLFEPPAFD
jgi:hypothetical protein